jgi:hypothetical protein
MKSGGVKPTGSDEFDIYANAEPVSRNELARVPPTPDLEIEEDISYSAKMDWSKYGRRVAELRKLGGPRTWFLNAFRGDDIFEDLEFSDGFREALRQNPVRAAGVNAMREAVRSSKPLADLLDAGVDAVAEIGVGFNWAPFPADVRNKIRKRFGADAFAECRDPEVQNNLDPALPTGVGAVVTFRVPVTQLTSWDLEPITKAIKHALKLAIKNRPTAAEAPEMSPTIPPQRAFLLRCREREFRRDLERYRLHTKEGLSAREIAYYERAKKSPTGVDLDKIRRQARGRSVAGERAVAGSIRRISEAVLVRPYELRRRRFDPIPTNLMQEYRCTEHGRDCPRNCPTLEQWLNRVTPALPTVTTGKHRGEVRYGEHIDGLLHSGARRQSAVQDDDVVSSNASAQNGRKPRLRTRERRPSSHR